MGRVTEFASPSWLSSQRALSACVLSLIRDRARSVRSDAYFNRRQFAKRKADELEDFGEEAGGEVAESPFSKHPRQETEDGTRLVKEFLQTWAARVPESMAVDGDGSIPSSTSAEDEIRVLKEVAEEFKDRLAANAFTADLLATF